MDPFQLAFGLVTARFALRLWLGDSLVGDAASDIVDVIDRSIPGLLERRKARRYFEHVAETVATRTAPYLEHEFAGLPPDEVNASALAAETSLDCANISARTMAEVDFDAQRLEALIRSQDAGRADRALLGEGGTKLYDLLLTEACAYIVVTAPILPAYQAATLTEVLKRETQLIELVQQAIEGIPRPKVPANWGLGTDDERFENKYNKALAARADVLELFGVDLPAARKQYSLSVAYISLTVVADRGRTIKSGHRQPLDHAAHEVGDEYVRVEAALGASNRILVEGLAGHGKSTLLRWLAVSACKASFVGELEEWNDLTPFLIPLRRYVGKDFPGPEDFVSDFFPSIRGVMPEGWVTRRLAEGRGLILVDGLDELPGQQRTNAQQWLADLMEAFPDCRLVITSRPIEDSPGWDKVAGLKQTALQPMQMPDIRAFIAHWHRAAVMGEEDDIEREKVRSAEHQLIQALQERPAIRGLCDSPLLCALICALHRDRANRLPESRMELYDLALRMLLVYRDQQRQIPSSLATPLQFEEKRSLLQDFALWLHEAGASDADEAVYFRRIETKLPNLPHASGEASTVARELLERSGVLRRPAEERVDFVHRTFLEYLASAALIDDDAIEKIVLNADKHAWREVVIMAAGHANHSQRQRLIELLIQRGEKEESLRHRLYLLAVACMETSSSDLQPGLVTRLKECLSDIMPPTNMTEAATVAAAGPLAVPELIKHSRYAVNASACVRALALIATPDAFEALKHFGTEDRVTVTRQLIRAWPQFDAEAYAREVLADSPLDRGILILSDPDYIQHLHYLKQLEGVFLDFPGRVDSLEEVADFPAVYGMDISHAYNVSDLAGLQRFPDLRTLWLRSGRSLKSLRGISSASGLQRLNLEGCQALSDIEELTAFESMHSIDLSHSDISSLRPLDGLELAELVLRNCNKVPGVSAVDLRAKRLQLTGARLHDFQALGETVHLKELVLGLGSNASKTLTLPLNNALEDLSISTAGDSWVTTGGGGVKKASLIGSPSPSPHSISSLVNLRILTTWYSTLSDVHTFVNDFPSLQHLNFHSLRADLRELDVHGFQVTTRGSSLHLRKEG